jgi:hypothetical protein
MMVLCYDFKPIFATDPANLKILHVSKVGKSNLENNHLASVNNVEFKFLTHPVAYSSSRSDVFLAEKSCRIIITCIPAIEQTRGD